MVPAIVSIKTITKNINPQVSSGFQKAIETANLVIIKNKIAANIQDTIPITKIIGELDKFTVGLRNNHSKVISSTEKIPLRSLLAQSRVSQ